MAKYCFLSFFVLLLVGCATFQGLARLKSLEDTLDAYEQAMRWGEYQLVGSFMEGTEQHILNLEELEKIKVTSYRLMESHTSEDKLQAHQTVEIKYFNKDYLIVKTVVDEQRWEYDLEQETWRLRSSLPDFK